jgi:hypothetical protein
MHTDAAITVHETAISKHRMLQYQSDIINKGNYTRPSLMSVFVTALHPITISIAANGNVLVTHTQEKTAVTGVFTETQTLVSLTCLVSHVQFISIINRTRK